MMVKIMITKKLIRIVKAIKLLNTILNYLSILVICLK